MIPSASPALDNLVLSNEPFFLEGADDRPACLFLHGLGGGPYEVGLLAPFLNERGWPCRAIVYPGHDYRPVNGKMPDSYWEDWVARAGETYDQLVASHGEVIVIGFSTGCPVSLALALEKQNSHPVKGLVLMAPFMAIAPSRWVPILGAAEFANRLLGNLVGKVPRKGLAISDPALREAAMKACHFKTFNLRAVNSALDLIKIVKSELGGVKQPTLIFQGKDDSVVAPQGAQWIFDGLASEDKTLHWLENSNHFVPLNGDRDFVFEKIQAFLDRL
ncbi:MAG: alpha/beta fold hydrolase [Cyanobacteria bacterium P01_D01_bin.73]